MKELDKETKAKRNEQYNDWARKRPAYICLGILIAMGIAMGIIDLFSTKLWWRAIFYVLSISAVSSALFFFFRFFLRDISKLYPGKIIFCDRLKPTTRLLYSSDTNFSDENKKAIRKKVLAKKSIDLEKYKDKSYNNKKYVKRIDDAVAWLLEVTRFDDILFEYNCVYGFYRNLTAALLVDSILLFVLAAVDKWAIPLPLGDSFLWIGIILLVITLITTLLAYTNGMTYAKKLYNVFLCLDDNKDNY